MHAERCVVCNGHGKIRKPTGTPESNTTIVPCHGCQAQGWLTVLDMADVLSVAERPKPTGRQHVYLSDGLAKRLLEDGQQYSGHATDAGYELTAIWIGSLCIMDPEKK